MAVILVVVLHLFGHNLPTEYHIPYQDMQSCAKASVRYERSHPGAQTYCARQA